MQTYTSFSISVIPEALSKMDLKEKLPQALHFYADWVNGKLS